MNAGSQPAIDRAVRDTHDRLTATAVQLARELAIGDQPDGAARREAELLRHLAAGTASASGMEFFRALVQHLASALGVRYAFVTECTDRTLTRVRTLAFWTENRFSDNIEYALSGTPCENVIAGDICLHPQDLQGLFPKDTGLAQLQAESFLGLPIRDAWENILGHVAALDDRPMDDRQRGLAILQIFAARAAAELERLRAEGELKEQYAELSKRTRYESVIGTVTRAVHRSLDVPEVLDTAVQSLHQRIDGADSVGIYLVEGETAVLQAQAGFPAAYLEAAGRLPRDQGAIWKVIAGGKRRYSGDAARDRSVAAAARALRAESWLCEPILDECGTIGTINVASRRRNAFDEEELSLLEIVAQQIGLAITSAQQAEALKRAQEELREALRRLERSRLGPPTAATALDAAEPPRPEPAAGEVVGHSAAIRRVLHRIEQVAGTDATVLVTGETGTGKELIARAIHQASRRRHRVFLPVNCGAIAPTLIESELFGHEKGAFTGAVGRKIGRFELADGGTLLLDEIGDLPLDVQVKLLRVLQEGEVERVGGAGPLGVDVRVIAATHRDLEAAVAAGDFRVDLYYRLNVFPIVLPSLRERRQDIPILARHFMARISARLGTRVETIPPDVMTALLEYSWPGNIRELANVIERGVIVSRGTALELGEWPGVAERRRPPPAAAARRTLEQSNREHILEALERTGWRVSGSGGAAELLGLKPTTLEARMKKLGIARPGRRAAGQS